MTLQLPKALQNLQSSCTLYPPSTPSHAYYMALHACSNEGQMQAPGKQSEANRKYVSDGSPDAHSSELSEALQRVRDQLHSTRSSAAVCLICLENMRNDDAIWHCYRGCCCVLHLVCMQAWSRQQVAAATYTASSESSRCSTM